jgi:hypothetical protein
VLQSEAVQKLLAFAEKNKETEGKYTIGDEKVRFAKFRKIYANAKDSFRNIMSS